MHLIKRHLLRKVPVQRYTCEQLLADPWVSGEHFRIVKDRAESAAHASEEHVAAGSLGGAARRMRLHNAKRKFRRGIRAIMAANLLSHLLAGLEKEKVLVSIGQVYDEARLRELYEVFGQRASAESHDDEREGFFDVAALKASTKVLSKEGFCAVLMRTFPEVAGSTEAAEELFKQFQEQVEQQSGAQDEEEHKDEEHRREMAKRREQEKEAHANLIDYREWTVSMSALCMKADTE